MSTRANIVVTDGYERLWFYRHSDGSPDVASRPLLYLLRQAAIGRLRRNAGQFAGWLILIGHAEYRELGRLHGTPLCGSIQSLNRDEPPDDAFCDWKVGSMEPTTGLHGDAEFLYVIDLAKCSGALRCYRVPRFDTSQGQAAWIARAVADHPDLDAGKVNIDPPTPREWPLIDAGNEADDESQLGTECVHCGEWSPGWNAGTPCPVCHA